MQDMMEFISWFISQLPVFLMTEPISAFTAMAVLFAVGSLVRYMIHMR